MTDLHQRNGDTKESIDYVLLILVLLLVVFGLVVLYSTSAYNGRVKFADPAYYLRKQFFATSIGLFSMYLVSCMDYRRLQNYAWIGYGIALMLSTAVLFVGREYNGSKRWLALGPLSFQPSEYAKLAVVVLLAAIVSRNASHMKSWKYMFLVILLILPVVGLVGSNNLSTAIIILGIAVILIFVANPQFLPFLWIGGTGVGFIGIFLSLESYRLERLAIWRNPELYEKGYQTMQGLYAIGSGGLFGVGLGESMQKLGFVPEAQNDMIFSIICEELGLTGAVAVLVIFGLLIWRLMVIATWTKDLFGALLAAGVMGHIMIQVILNVAVVTNTIPNTGITLPFVSYGGTSVVFLLLEMGIALSVSRGVRKEH
ncbi:FtsW/RodA/SpoVE family cell cycle protein [Hominiventricola aquisgranensis]|jgi:cell division protein FtsW|uniref:Probable peptidoglycan glycosyltransferase FtsW n=1 Tax=Hominiventricola aquisgranensis TaxID=3133164 RepID=A0ABV1I296_9FIRM|nr:putative lipid II flippase FtsW [Clostridiaceae bacterium]RHQ26963.1 cell division protein FtsW [Clostridiaceae bacterium AF29-16BH]